MGFIWIGTSDGLNRFDGYSFKKYYKNSAPLSLGNNNVNAMAEDLQGRIWLATGSGIYYYNPSNEAFRQIEIGNSATSKLVEDICVDENGVVWSVENSNVIVKINANSDLSAQYIKLDSLLEEESLFNKRITYADGFIWVFSSRGIVRFDNKNMKARVIASNVKFNSPRTLKKGKQGEILVADWNFGVFKVDTDSLTVSPLLRDQSKIFSDNIIGITDVQYDLGGSVWILSYPGLQRFTLSGNVESFNTKTGYDNDYDKMVYFTSTRDRDGNIWLGTQDEGVIVVSENNNAFTHYSIDDGNYKDLPASSFLIDKDKVLFCNNFGAFYSDNSIDTKQGNFRKISNSSTSALSKYNDNEYVMFEKNKVIVYNTTDGSKKNLFETYDLQNGIIDSRGIVWVTHWEEGLEGFDLNTGKKYYINVDEYDKSLNVVFTLLEDADGSLWLGTFGAGLQNIKNPTSDTPIVRKYRDDGTENSLANNFILSMHDDGKGSLWLGTNGGGLNIFDKKTATFRHYTTSNGLKGNVIQSVTSDLDGNIWFASSVISKLNIADNSITHYELSDGVTSKYFTCHAQNSADGMLYFGDDKGILAFNPNKIQDRSIAPSPVITSVRLFGQTVQTRDSVEKLVPFPKSITFTDTIILPYYLNSLSLEFASIQHLNSANVNYLYKLEGVDNQWIFASSSERFATYAGLPYGEYVFQVKASNERNSWSQPRIVQIIITPPWWKRIWFQIGASIFIVLLIASAIFIYVQNLRRRNQNLEGLIQKRTNELQQANENLKDERLVIEMKNKHLNEFLETKEKLIKIIAHDFKGPLNGILGYAELLLKENVHNAEEISKYTSSISKVAKSLVNQMVSLLNWAQSEDTNLKANPVEINPEILVEDSIDLVRALADQKQISIENHSDCKSNIKVDPRMGSMIFRNILSNAIKFTPTGGAVTVIIKELENFIDISFIDNGVGIKDETIDRLMNSEDVLESEQGTNKEQGTGIGLRMSKTFIDKNQGVLSITSGKQQGSVFTVSLPKGKKKTVLTDERTTLDVEFEKVEKGSDKAKEVLVIDDDKETLEIIDQLLGSYYEVITVSDGREGMNTAFQIIPDIIISDIKMSGISGIEICEYLKKNKKTAHIPVLLVSSHTNVDIKNKAFDAGANDYIEKPFNSAHLLKKIESMFILSNKIRERARIDIANEVYPKMAENYENEVVKQVNEFVEKNMNLEKLNTSIVAKELAISRAHLWRIYKSETGMSLGDYIRDRKLQKASAMLLTGKYRISDIAYELGYADPRYFSRWFTKGYGMSPTQYIDKMTK